MTESINNIDHLSTKRGFLLKLVVAYYLIFAIIIFIIAIVLLIIGFSGTSIGYLLAGTGLFYSIILAFFSIKLYHLNNGARLIVIALSWLVTLYLATQTFVSSNFWVPLIINLSVIYTLQFHGPTKELFYQQKELDKRKMPKRYQKMLERDNRL